jgi:LysM repeat protein
MKLGKKLQTRLLKKEEVEFPEGKLPPHLAKFFDKKGNLNPDAAKRVEKGRTKRGVKIIDKTPKGYGPNEEVDYDESFELFLEWPQGVSTGHPVAAPTSHIAPVSSALVGNDEDPTDKDSKEKDSKEKDSRAKVDTLLRLGLVPRKDLVKYRRALKGGAAALKHPELRNKIGDLLQRLLKITTSDKAIYAKLRLRASEKKKIDKEVKEDIERRADFKMVKVKLPDGRVIMKKSRPEIKIGDVDEKMQSVGVKRINPTRSLAPPSNIHVTGVTAGPSVQKKTKNPSPHRDDYGHIRAQKEDHVDEAESPLDRRHEREKDRLVVRHARQKAAATVRTVRKKAMESLEKKSDKSGIPVEVLQQVFNREDNFEKGFNRVNSFIAFGAARKLDNDLEEGSGGDKSKASYWRKGAPPLPKHPSPSVGKWKKDPPLRGTAFGTRRPPIRGEELNIDPDKHHIKQVRDIATHPTMKPEHKKAAIDAIMKQQKTSSEKSPKMKKPGSNNKVTEEHGAGEWGTNELTNQYKKDTPGQSKGHSLAFDYVMKPRIAPTAKEIAMQEAQPNKFTSETVLICRMNKTGEMKEMRCPKSKVHEYLGRGWQKKS